MTHQKNHTPTRPAATLLLLTATAYLAHAHPGSPSSEQTPGILHIAGHITDEDVIIHFRFPTDSPSWYHQYWIRRGDAWVRYGSGTNGPDEHGFYEDRISIMWCDGSVADFSTLGGFTTVHPGMRHTRSQADPDDVRNHPHLGDQLGRTDVRKFIRESRDPSADGPLWKNILPPDELMELRQTGRFLDLWQWRAHRSNPVGFADNGYILEYRLNSQGRPMFTTNQNPETGEPLMMFDPEKTGFRALRLEKLTAKKYSQQDLYYLKKSTATPYDPDHPWTEGDAIPQRLLQQPDGSRGAIRARGEYTDGAWHVRLTRTLESPNPLDSLEFQRGKTYTAAFSVHTGGVGGGDHLVSMPVTIGFGTNATIRLDHHPQNAPEASNLNWQKLHLFHPGDPTPP